MSTNQATDPKTLMEIETLKSRLAELEIAPVSPSPVSAPKPNDVPTPQDNNPYPPGTITLFAPSGPILIQNVSQVNWSAYSTRANLCTFVVPDPDNVGKTLLVETTLPFIYTKNN
jgi:hypothetical protein